MTDVTQASTSDAAATLNTECSLLREWLSLAGMEKAAIRDMAAEQLAEQVRARFDATKVDEDAAQQQCEPEWVRLMVGDARWRPLLYELCAAHPQSALLQAAVRMLSQSEHAAEVQANASLGQILGDASSADTFVSSMAAHLIALQQGQRLRHVSRRLLLRR